MKILFCNYNQPDYGLDTLYDGLCQLLGPENVLDYPHKPALHGSNAECLLYYPDLINYPTFFAYPTYKTDDEKLTMLKNNEFDIILVGCNNDSGFWDSLPPKINPIIHQLLSDAPRTIPVILIDQGDNAESSSKVNIGLIKKYHARLYFKREYLKNKIYPSMVVPLNFSYPRRHMAISIDTKRANILFWAGKAYPQEHYRIPYLKRLEKMEGTILFSDCFKQDEYLKQLSSYKIGLNLRGYGYDTVRYYELPAHGALLFSERLNIVIENDFKDDETAVFFDSPEEMTDKLQYLLKNESYVDKIRIKGHEWFKKYHTSKRRAKQLIDKIKSA